MNNTLKRIMISAVSALLCVSLVACGNTNTDDNGSDTTTSGNDVATTTPAPEGNDTTTGEDAATTTPAPENNDTTTSATETTTAAPAEDQVAIIDPQVDTASLGGKLWQAFLTTMKEKPETTPEEMANLLLTNEAIEFMGGAMALEPNQEFFNGFKEYKITGYESGAVYMPMIGSIAFIGYVFELPEGADVEAFIKNLSDNADPRWNVCVTAGQTVIGAYDTTVFFLMCP